MRSRRTRITTAIGAPLVALALLGNSSCEPIDCNEEGVADEPPSAALIAAAQEVVGGEAVEVEAEVTVREPHPEAGAEVECVVGRQGGKWVWLNVSDETA